MNKFKFLLVFCCLLLVTGTFNASYGVADETALDSSQMTDQMEEENNSDVTVMTDEESYTEEGESDYEYQDESTSHGDLETETEEYVEEYEGPSDT